MEDLYANAPNQDQVQSLKKVIVKNLCVAPKSVNNSGAWITVRCTVVSPQDGAKIEKVYLDFRHTFLYTEKPLRPVPGCVLKKSMEGDYLVRFKIPYLMDTGEYRVPVIAVDSTGAAGKNHIHFCVQYADGSREEPPGTSGFSARLEKISNTPFRKGNIAVFLDSGETAVQKRLSLIKGAKREINLAAYTFDTKGVCAEIAEALFQKSESRVMVNLLLNGDSQLPASPIGTLIFKLNEFVDGHFQEWLNSTFSIISQKRKVDTEKIHNGYMRVILFSSSYISKREETELKPVDHWLRKVASETAASTGLMQVDQWIESADEKLNGLYKIEDIYEKFMSFNGPGGLPALPLLDYAIHEKALIADGEFAIIGGRNLEDAYFTKWMDTDLYLEGPVVKDIHKAFKHCFREILESKNETLPGLLPEKRIRKKGDIPVLFVRNRPWYRDYSALLCLVHAIRSCKKNIFTVSQYLILPDCLLRDALMEAAGRGVEIIILMNSQITCKQLYYGAGFFASLNYIEPLLKSGIKIYAVRGKDGAEEAEQPYLHQKEFIFDEVVTAVGSFNLSLRSAYIESENLVFIEDEAICANRTRKFRDFIQTMADEITMDTLHFYRKSHSRKIEIAHYMRLLF